MMALTPMDAINHLFRLRESTKDVIRIPNLNASLRRIFFRLASLPSAHRSAATNRSNSSGTKNLSRFDELIFSIRIKEADIAVH